LHDEAGAAATRHNLEFILEPPPPPPNGNGESPVPGPRGWKLLVGAAVIGALAIGGVAALAGGGGTPLGPSDTENAADETAGGSQGAGKTRGSGGGRTGGGATQPPSITITTPASNATYPDDKRVRVSFSCRDDRRVDRCDGSVDGKAVQVGSLLPLVVGSHVLRVNAVDAAGNKNDKRLRYTVTRTQGDVTLSVTIRSPKPGASFIPAGVTRAVFNCAVGDKPLDCVGTVSLTEEPDVTIRSGDQLPAGIGDHTLTVTADDHEHKSVTVRRTYTVARRSADLTIAFGQPYGENERVSVSPTGRECRSTCTLAVVPGEPVTLRAEYLDTETNEWSQMAVQWQNCTPTAAGCIATPGNDGLTVEVSNIG
jgi:hypothetical protein